MPGEAILTEKGRGVCCLACGLDLHYLPDSYPLIFRCEHSHLFLLEDLLDHDFPGTDEGRRVPPVETLEFWKDRARLFRELAGHALLQGHVFVAADFQEAGNRVDSWAAKLAAVLSKSRIPEEAE